MKRPLPHPGNLPAATTSFVGRRRELSQLRRALSRSRLVSVVGPGGVGKTRLATQLAADLGRGFPDGVWLVELADLGDSSLLGHAVMAALGLRDQAAAAPRVVLQSHLHDKRLLLLIDNCEHHLDAVAELIAGVLAAAPAVRALVTSREPLSVPGEHVMQLLPLEPPGDVASLAEMSRNEAVALFVDRAASASGTFVLSEANRSAVARVCRELDGLPLALELAAARTRLLTPQQILGRLTDRLGLLAGRFRAGPARHRTMGAALDWSHDLLVPNEAALFRRLSVFGGPFTIEDVGEVCAWGDVPEADVLTLLAALVDKSLVHAEYRGSTAVYRLHAVVREYARLRLEGADEVGAVERRFADHFQARARLSANEAQARLAEWLEWMDLEIDNVREVLRRCLLSDSVRGLELAGSLGWYWAIRGTTEGAQRLDALLGLPRPGVAIGDPVSRSVAWASYSRGVLAIIQGDGEAAREALQAARAAADSGSPTLLALIASSGSIAARMRGDPVAGRDLLEQAQAAAEQLDDPPVTLAMLHARALGAMYDGDNEATIEASIEGERLSRRLGYRYTLELMLINLGVSSVLSASSGAESYLDEATQIARELDDRVGLSIVIAARAARAATARDARLAARLLGAADAIRAGAGARMAAGVEGLETHAAQVASARLGPKRFDAELEIGRRMSRHAAISLALGEETARASIPSSIVQRPPLGARETEVAELVADGLSNKEIGTQLFISERTVDSHIRNMLDKLGFNTRAQIAGWIRVAAAVD